MLIDLSPNIQYKDLQRQLLQKMCRELYCRTEPMGIEKGNTVAADIVDMDVSFVERKRDSKGNFMLAGNSNGARLFIEFKRDASGKYIGDYLHFRCRKQRAKKESVGSTKRFGGNITVCSNS